MREVVPVQLPGRKGETTIVEQDERLRPDTSVEKLARLKPVDRVLGLATLCVSGGLGMVVAVERLR